MKSGVKPKTNDPVHALERRGAELARLGGPTSRPTPELMPRISAVLVHDGGTNYLGGIGATEAMLSDLTQVFTPVMSLDPKYPFEVSKVAGLMGGGSDPRLVPLGQRPLASSGGRRAMPSIPHNPPHPVRHLRRRHPRSTRSTPPW